MTKWWNYKQAEDLPPDVVERMWRALDTIAEACEWKHPADPNFMTKDKIRDLAMRSIPSDSDEVAQ